MSWFAEQVDERRRLDDEELQDAYARMAAAVMGRDDAPLRFRVDDAAALGVAVTQIMDHFRLRVGEVPTATTDVSERLDYLLRPSGVMVRPVRLTGTWWHAMTGSYVGRLKEAGTPVALLPAGIRGYAYVDPVTRKRVIIDRHTAQTLAEDALVLYRPLPSGPLTARAMVSYALRSLGAFDYAIIVVSTLVATLAGMAPAIGAKLLFGTVIASHAASLIVPIAFLLLGMAISSTLFALVSSMLNARISGRLTLYLEAALYARILLLHPSFFKGRTPGELTSHMLNVPALVSAVASTIFEVGLAAVVSLLYVLVIVRFAPALALPALVTLLSEMALAVVALRVQERHTRREMERQARLSGVTPEVLRGIQKIKLARAESRAFAYWARSYADVVEATYGRPALLLSAPATIPLVTSIGTIAIYCIAATHGVAADDFMVFNYAFGAAAGAVGALVAAVPQMAVISPQLELLEPLLQAPTESFAGKRQVSSLDGSIEVSNLSFSYGDDLPLVLDNVSLAVRPGEYVAIVGATGCGKSTLMRLLLGFERPLRGSIQYGPHNLDNVDVRSLRHHIGVVMQSGSLFTGDLFANITVANPRATIDDAWEAAELASIADDIRRMPMGMNTLVGANGGGFSGGQKQRILIARAVCGRPSILMFDEATSSLDNVAQRHVSDALASLGCTRIVIAHRLSTIRACDRIIMLDGGHIVEEGTYDELTARGGAFAELVERQRIEDEDECGPRPRP